MIKANFQGIFYPPFLETLMIVGGYKITSSKCLSKKGKKERCSGSRTVIREIDSHARPGNKKKTKPGWLISIFSCAPPRTEWAVREITVEPWGLQPPFHHSWPATEIFIGQLLRHLDWRPRNAFAVTAVWFLLSCGGYRQSHDSLAARKKIPMKERSSRKNNSVRRLAITDW